MSLSVIRHSIAGAAALPAAIWGDLHLAVQVLVLLMGIDLAMGLVAIILRQSPRARTGIAAVNQKAAMIGAVAAAAVAALILTADLSPLLAAYYAAMQGLSVLDNIVAAGVPVPSQVHDALSRYRDAAERNVQTAAEATPAPESVIVRRPSRPGV